MIAIDHYQRRYLAAAHAVQSGVAVELEHDPTSGTPKHLRVGLQMAIVQQGAIATLLAEKGLIAEDTPANLRAQINLVMAAQGGIAALLIAKGLITETEYWRAIAEATEREQRDYEARLSQRFGTKITLG